MVFLLAEVDTLGNVVSQEFHTEYPDTYISDYNVYVIPARSEKRALQYLETLTATLTGRRFTHDQIRIY